mmetsp:Transcript_971/g.2067  ORF Transcript_971/g.2067 Transcript_971/m.2067 type:complete len:94 (+) Transcript_971:1195-1476(+)
MRIVGADNHFHYGSEAGAAGSFRARVYHASVEPPPGSQEHLKIAFFFRACPKGERRAKRALGASSNFTLAQRRQRVTHDLNAFGFEAESALPR